MQGMQDLFIYRKEIMKKQFYILNLASKPTQVVRLLILILP